MTEGNIPSELREVIYTDCVVCNSRKRQSSPVTNATTITTTVTTSTCTDLELMLSKNKNVIAIGDCEKYKANCADC